MTGLSTCSNFQHILKRQDEHRLASCKLQLANCLLVIQREGLCPGRFLAQHLRLLWKIKALGRQYSGHGLTEEDRGSGLCKKRVKGCSEFCLWRRLRSASMLNEHGSLCHSTTGGPYRTLSASS